MNSLLRQLIYEIIIIEGNKPPKWLRKAKKAITLHLSQTNSNIALCLIPYESKNDNKDKVSINLCHSLSWATFQIHCHSCHLCHSAKDNKYIYHLVINTASDSHPQMGMSVTHWIDPNGN